MEKRGINEDKEERERSMALNEEQIHENKRSIYAREGVSKAK